jgi:ribose transport system substrate-binding protein
MGTVMIKRRNGILGAMGLLSAPALIRAAWAQDSNAAAVLAEANASIASAAAPASKWDGPTTGPKAQKGKSIIYISADQRNGGALGVGKGVAEAAKAIGWDFKIIDGQGSVPSQTSAVGQAIAQRPDGIILGTVDAVGQKATLAQAPQLGIKVVGWHASAVPGPVEDPAVFANITTPPKDIALTAANYAIAMSDGKAQVAIMRNSETAIGRLKGDTIRARIEESGTCKVLSFNIMPIAESSDRMPSLTASLLQRFPGQLDWMLAINDLYFDFAVPSLRSANIPPAGVISLVSAGDGSVSAYQRIRSGQYQVATVPEPLNLQGWIAVDELNRAFAGEKWSGYMPKVHLVTKDNIGTDGGPENHFDPSNNYRDEYRKIWGT